MKGVVNGFREASRSKQVKLVIRGFQKFYDKHSPAAGRMKLPFTMDLALKAKELMDFSQFFGPSSDAAQLLTERVYTAMAVGIFFMFRCSEHIESKRGVATPVRRDQVVFFDSSGAHIPYSSVGQISAAKVTINVPFSKTDHSGFGRRVSHIRTTPGEVCIVALLERWTAMTRDIFGAKEKHFLYEVPGYGCLRLNTLHEVMQATIRALKIPGYSSATSHSLRYGGATMLAAAGFPQYIIAHYGGWTADSEALKRYARPSEESVHEVSKKMSAMATVDISRQFITDGVARIHSGSGR
jgi:hypothetical protein